MADQALAKSIGRVQTRIQGIYGEKAVAAHALCQKYASQAEKTVRQKQGTKQAEGSDKDFDREQRRARGEGFYWTNRTSMAIAGIEGFADRSDGYVGWGLRHTMDYGRWLELADSRRRAALEPTVRELAPAFMADIRKIYGE